MAKNKALMLNFGKCIPTNLLNRGRDQLVANLSFRKPHLVNHLFYEEATEEKAFLRKAGRKKVEKLTCIRSKCYRGDKVEDSAPQSFTSRIAMTIFQLASLHTESCKSLNQACLFRGGWLVGLRLIGGKL